MANEALYLFREMLAQNLANLVFLGYLVNKLYFCQIDCVQLLINSIYMMQHMSELGKLDGSIIMLWSMKRLTWFAVLVCLVSYPSHGHFNSIKQNQNDSDFVAPWESFCKANFSKLIYFGRPTIQILHTPQQQQPQQLTSYIPT